MRPDPTHSSNRSVVIRKPDSTKKRSTPRYPPLAQLSCRWYATTPITATPRRPLSAGRCRPVTAVVADGVSARSCTSVASVTPLQAACVGRPVTGRSTKSPAPARKVGSSSPAVRSKAMRGLRSPAGRVRLAAARTGKYGPSLDDLPRSPEGPAEEGRLGQRLGKGWGEAEHAAAATGEVEAREITGEHGRVTLLGAELDPGSQQHVRHRRSRGRRPARPGRPGARSSGTRPKRPAPRPGSPAGAARPCRQPGGTVLPRRGRLGRRRPPDGVSRLRPAPTNLLRLGPDRPGRAAPARRTTRPGRAPSAGPARREETGSALKAS